MFHARAIAASQTPGQTAEQAPGYNRRVTPEQQDRAARLLASETLRRDRSLEICASSGSMRPLVQIGTRLRVEPLQGPPELGELVLFDRGGGAIVHRVIGFTADGIVPKGDALDRADAPVPRDAVLGQVVAIDGHRINTPTWRWLQRRIARFSPHSRALWTPLRLAGRARRRLGLDWL